MSARIGRKFATETYPESQIASAMLGILQNRVEQASANGTVIAGGSAITPNASLTIKGKGRVKVTATASYSLAVGAAGAEAFLTIQLNAGPVLTQWVWTRSNAAKDQIAGVFEIDLPANPGDILHVHWQTTVGDVAVTLGDPATPGFGAVLLLEELL